MDENYNKSKRVCMFYPPGKCAHCDGNHFGAPFQSGKITGEDGKLEQVPCPVQEHFLFEFGQERMLEIIANGITCDYCVCEVNGLKVTCGGNHPKHIHTEVMQKLEGHQLELLTNDQKKRIWMAELPVRDDYGDSLCGKKQNDPPNEICLLRVYDNGDHKCGRESCLTLSMIRRMKIHEVNSSVSYTHLTLPTILLV